MSSETCQHCSRDLSDPNSKRKGAGRICAHRYGAGLQAAGSSYAQIDALARFNDPEINDRIRKIKLAIGARRIGDARVFLEKALSIAQTLKTSKPAKVPAKPQCEKCHDSGVVTETQDTGAPGVSFRADVECDHRVTADLPVSESWCEGCFADKCVSVCVSCRSAHAVRANRCDVCADRFARILRREREHCEAALTTPRSHDRFVTLRQIDHVDSLLQEVAR